MNAESVLEENNQKLNQRSVYLNECENHIDELSEKIHHLQSTFSNMKVCLPRFLKYITPTYYRKSHGFCWELKVSFCLVIWNLSPDWFCPSFFTTKVKSRRYENCFTCLVNTLRDLPIYLVVFVDLKFCKLIQPADDS